MNNLLSSLKVFKEQSFLLLFTLCSLMGLMAFSTYLTLSFQYFL